MGTKNNPGAYDCYASAAPDEPIFVLLGRDPLAPFLIAMWADLRAAMGEDAGKVAEAHLCVVAAMRYLVSIGKEPADIVGLMKLDDAQSSFRFPDLSMLAAKAT